MAIDEREENYEKARLEAVLHEIKKQLEQKKESTCKAREELINAQKEMRENVTIAPSDLFDLDGIAQAWSYQMEIRRSSIAHKLSDIQSQRLERMLSSPYFGRIDFREHGEEDMEKIYIGISNLINENKDFLIYDWRAPISSMFYDYETGKARYTCPDFIVEGDMLLKRQFSIKNGKMEYMFDSSIKIDDEMLQEILGRSADSRMKAIVTSIQREQNRAIRDEDNPFLIVQGPAGSGKTSIALHRIAYILYKHRESITPKNIIIFSPNQVFNDYISGVLPELGEENMNETTFMEYARASLGTSVFIEGMGEQMEYLLTSRDTRGYGARIKNIKYKASKDFIDVLKNYMKYMEEKGIIFEDIAFNNITVMTKEEASELFHTGYGYLPMIRRLDKIMRRILFLLKPLERERYNVVKEQLLNSDENYLKSELMEKSLKIVHDEVKGTKDTAKAMTSVDVLNLYRKLFEDEKLFESLCPDGKLPDGFESIKDSTLHAIDSKNIKYEDVAPILFIKAMLGLKPDTSYMKYVIIDEVQDYTPLQFEVLKQLFPNCRVTLLGDPDQSINAYMNAGEYEFDMQGRVLIKLTKSYRSTKEITGFCRSILGHEEEFEYVNRNGEKPVLFSISRGNLYKCIIQGINELKEKGCKSIAVICRSRDKAHKLYENIKDDTGAVFIAGEDENFTIGTIVIPSYLAKGLEFDGVLIADADDYYMEEERKLFYTSCTRALHKLYLYSTGKPAAFLPPLESGLYEKIQL